MRESNFLLEDFSSFKMCQMSNNENLLERVLLLDGQQHPWMQIAEAE